VKKLIRMVCGFFYGRIFRFRFGGGVLIIQGEVSEEAHGANCSMGL
jgi:hypothetical protein